MAAHWITYKGKQILYVDFRGLSKNEELLAVLEETRRQVAKSPARVLMLIDVRDASISSEFMNQIKANSSGEMQARIARTALVGIVGLKKILVDGYTRVAGSRFGENTKVCETEEQAKEYLVAL